VVIVSEWAIFIGVLLIVLSGGRSEFIDRFGRRGDLIVLGLLLALFALLHSLVKRRLLPRLERRFSPAPYDEHRILFDLGQEARAATGIDQLYASIAARIGESFETPTVSIFVRDEASGNYVCRICTRKPMVISGPDGGEISSSFKLSRDAFVVRRLSGLTTPLVIEPAEFETWAQALSSATPALREARRLERETLQQIDAHLLVQVRTKDRLSGILVLNLRRGQFPYSAADKEVLMSVAAQLGLVIENARLAERMVAEERLRRELALAAEVQRRLLPERAPDCAALELSGCCQPARGVGGDYYDFVSGDNGQISIVIADVSGKGISAALVMSNLQASLRSQTMAQMVTKNLRVSLVDMVAAVNRLLCSSTDSATYVTFFGAQFDEQSRKLTYVNAGHNPPFLLRTSKEIAREKVPVAVALTSNDRNGDAANGWTQLTTGGPVMGIFERCSYEQETIQLHSGDLLVAYTDGVTEALDVAGEEFSEARLQEIVASLTNLSADELRDVLLERIQSWCAGAPQHDDLTFIVLKVK
jgi:sigma-B regulation protein RsbU (phosphoserine phosphatase)